MVHLANLTLHLRVHDAGADGDGGDGGFFDGERGGEVVEDGFGGSVRSPGLVRSYRGAGGGEKDYTVGDAEGGECGLDLGVGLGQCYGVSWVVGEKWGFRRGTKKT